VHLQFPLVRADELPERFPVARAGQVDQVRRHGDMVAYRRRRCARSAVAPVSIPA